MEDNLNIKTTLKADIFDFIIPVLSFLTVYFLSFELINDEDYIKAALTYIVFFILATIYILIKRKRFYKEAILTGSCCVVTAASLALHGNFLCVGLLMFFSALYFLTLTRSNIHSSGSYLYAFDLLQRALITPIANLFLPLRAMLSSVKSLKKSKRNFGVLAGLLLAIPVLAVLIFLLMNSDAAFESLADSILDSFNDLIPDTEISFYSVIALVFTPYIVSVLFNFKHNIDSEKGIKIRANIKKLRFANTAFLGGFLGSVCLLYVVYLLSQTAYFFSAFGGKLPDGTEITLSEYARRGFFEMSAVAAINLCLIGAGVIFSKRQSEKFTKTFRAIALFLCLFTMVLITTAMSKMVLYISEMGLTHKRLAVSVFNVLMFLAFIFIIARLFKKDFPYFRYITAISIVIVTLFMFVGADSIIGSYNTWAYLSGKHEKIDINLLSYDLNTYDSIKSLYKLKDDPLYGRAAKLRLDDYYVADFPHTIKGYMAKRFVETNIDEFKKLYNEYGLFFDWDISGENENAESEDFSAINGGTEIFFLNDSAKAIAKVSLFDGHTWQNVLFPEKTAVFSYDLYGSFDEVKTCSVTIYFENGYSWESDLDLDDTNFFEIADSADSDGIDFIHLNSVDSFEEAVDYVATIK